MKKLCFLFILLVGISFVSCKSNRTCSCTSTKDGPGGVVVTELPDTTLQNVTKSEIKEFCQSKNDTYTAGLETISTSCTY